MRPVFWAALLACHGALLGINHLCKHTCPPILRKEGSQGVCFTLFYLSVMGKGAGQFWCSFLSAAGAWKQEGPGKARAVVSLCTLWSEKGVDSQITCQLLLLSWPSSCLFREGKSKDATTWFTGPNDLLGCGHCLAAAAVSGATWILWFRLEDGLGQLWMWRNKNNS